MLWARKTIVSFSQQKHVLNLLQFYAQNGVYLNLLSIRKYFVFANYFLGDMANNKTALKLEIEHYRWMSSKQKRNIKLLVVSNPWPSLQPKTMRIL